MTSSKSADEANCLGGEKPRTSPVHTTQMSIPNSLLSRRLQKGYLILVAAIVAYGTYLSMTSEGYFDLSSLKYFTNQSNLFMAVGYIAIFLLINRSDKRLVLLRDYLSTTILLAMIVTGLIYNLVLVPLNGNAPPFSDYTNFSTHLLAPVLAFVYFLFFNERGGVRPSSILIAKAYPVAYWVTFVMIGDQIDFYPYFFMDPNQVGWTMLFVWFVALLAIFVVIGLLLLAFDRASCLAKLRV